MSPQTYPHAVDDAGAVDGVAVLLSELSRLRRKNDVLRARVSQLRKSRDYWHEEAKSWRWSAERQRRRQSA